MIVKLSVVLLLRVKFINAEIKVEGKEKKLYNNQKINIFPKNLRLGTPPTRLGWWTARQFSQPSILLVMKSFVEVDIDIKCTWQTQ